MLAPGSYVQLEIHIKDTLTPNLTVEPSIIFVLKIHIHESMAEKIVPVCRGSSETTTERYMENYKNVSQDIRDQLNAEAEAVQIILTGIDNDIYSTVDACPNACEMWKAIERLKQGESINVQDLETNLYWEFGKFTSRDGESLESYYSRFYKMMNELVRNQCHVTNHQVNVQFLLQLQPEWKRFVTLVKQSQELKTVSYHKLYDILKQHQNEVNEIRTERLARTANPLALVAQQQPVYHHQNHPTQNTQYSSTQIATSTRNRGKAIVTSSLLLMIQNLLRGTGNDNAVGDVNVVGARKMNWKHIYVLAQLQEKTWEKCERLEKELSKSRTMSKSFEALQKQAINLELDLQQKFLGTVKFGNDQIAPILGYGDLVQGTITIKRVYYVEGLNHNLFSVGQFCDADLEVAFRKSTCYIRDLKGNDLLTDPPPLNIHSTHQTPTQVPTVTAPENIIQMETIQKLQEFNTMNHQHLQYTSTRTRGDIISSC
ncbi:hypothetical protein Tco_0876230 [Tanacetum coccineum]|uniref:Retrovirus-related Pol polyprotein from transposon TNT 1-94-like beta-barrel domain-containing protein n=1 Tax=Tanacetum coccineum TaxID=301880 RepID=A0ABQ5BTC2_9ASTR